MASRMACPRPLMVLGWVSTVAGSAAMLFGATGVVAGLLMVGVLPSMAAPVSRLTLAVGCLWNAGLFALGAIAVAAGILLLRLDGRGRAMMEGVAWFGISAVTCLAILAVMGVTGPHRPSKGVL